MTSAPDLLPVDRCQSCSRVWSIISVEQCSAWNAIGESLPGVWRFGALARLPRCVEAWRDWERRFAECLLEGSKFAIVFRARSHPVATKFPGAGYIVGATAFEHSVWGRGRGYW